MYNSFVTLVAPVIATVGFGVVFVLILLNFNVLIGSDDLWYLVFIVPSIVLLCGVAGYARGEYLRKHNPRIYENIGSGKSPTVSEDEKFEAVRV